MKDIRVLVVDDESPARSELIYLLENISNNIIVVGEAANGLEALDFIDNNEIHVIFLDIEMPGIDGLEVAKNIIDNKKNIFVVFVTAYEEFAIKAFDVKAIDYLVKPFSPERLKKTIDRIKEEYKYHFAEDESKAITNNIYDIIGAVKEFAIEKIQIPCYENDKILLIKKKDIYYCEAFEGKVYVYSIYGKNSCSLSLQYLEDKLGLFRIHRSYLVNIDKIKHFECWFNGTYQVILDNKHFSPLPVSRRHVKKLKKFLNI